MNDGNTVYTQELLLLDTKRLALAYIQYVDGDLDVSVSTIDGNAQYDFNIRADTLKLLEDAYKRHLDEYLKS